MKLHVHLPSYMMHISSFLQYGALLTWHRTVEMRIDSHKELLLLDEIIRKRKDVM